jgi:glycosyltransferase involved in cell wall biosynthesis
MQFSVVVPLFNKQAYVARCLKSIFCQTHTDFELIVVNDGSTDGSERELASFVDARLRVMHRANQGVSVARNAGVAAAQHEIVFFLDADDTWEPGFLEQMARLVTLHPQAGVYASGTRKLFADGHAQECNIAAPAFFTETAILRDYCQTFVDLGQSPFSNSSFGVRRQTFIQSGGYTPGVRLTEDSDLWVRLSLISQMAFDPTPLANYYVETELNTRGQAQTADYEVTKTLRRLLAKDQIPQHLRLGAKRLLALQKHSQIKRLILLREAGAAWKRLLDWDVWVQRPQASLTLALAASVPHLVFVLLRRMTALGR